VEFYQTAEPVSDFSGAGSDSRAVGFVFANCLCILDMEVDKVRRVHVCEVLHRFKVSAEVLMTQSSRLILGQESFDEGFD
jgi:hypothetical protein